MFNIKTTLFFIALIVFALSGNKEEWKKRSIYQLLTDRFARNDGQTYSCDNLGIFILR